MAKKNVKYKARGGVHKAASVRLAISNKAWRKDLDARTRKYRNKAK